MESLKGSKERPKEKAVKLLDDEEVERMLAEAEEHEETEEDST